MSSRFYRACDVRFPFVWTSDTQPAARWHGAGEGPCHYLTTTPKGAWAEVIRHEAITDPDDLEDLERALWEVIGPMPTEAPPLPAAVMTGGVSTYPRCQAAARAIRNAGNKGLVAPSAALLSGTAELLSVTTSGDITESSISSQVVVLFAPIEFVGLPLAEGHCGPDVLPDVRPL